VAGFKVSIISTLDVKQFLPTVPMKKRLWIIFSDTGVHEQSCLDENRVYEQLEETVTTIPEMDIVNSYILDENNVLKVDHRHERQPIFVVYSSDGEHQYYLIFDHYEDSKDDAEVGLVTEETTREFDHDQPLVEAREEIVYTHPEVNQQSSVDQQPPTSNLLPLVPIVHSKHLFDPQMHVVVIQSSVPVEDINPVVSRFETVKVTFHKLIMHCLQFHDPVDDYIKLHFSNALEHEGLIFLSAFEGNICDHKNEISQFSCFPCLLWIICSEAKNSVIKPFEWLWWKFSFT
jgi:hypothetical protein